MSSLLSIVPQDQELSALGFLKAAAGYDEKKPSKVGRVAAGVGGVGAISGLGYMGYRGAKHRGAIASAAKKGMQRELGAGGSALAAAGRAAKAGGKTLLHAK